MRQRSGIDTIKYHTRLRISHGKVTKIQLNTTNKSQCVSPFPAGDHKAAMNRRESVALYSILDAKSAFDVVLHDSLLRKLFHACVESVSWSLIHSLHAEAESVLKWNGAYSGVFKVDQGVRQGRILSTDLNKLYDNGLSDRLQLTGVGCHIGEISCVVPGCADDSAVLEENERII